jgi:hypothetical protein
MKQKTVIAIVAVLVVLLGLDIYLRWRPTIVGMEPVLIQE